MCQSGAPSICPSGNLVWTDNKQKGHTRAGEQAREHGRGMTGRDWREHTSEQRVTGQRWDRAQVERQVWGEDLAGEEHRKGSRALGTKVSRKWKVTTRHQRIYLQNKTGIKWPKTEASSVHPMSCPPGSGDGGSRRPSPRLLVSLQMFIRNQWSRIHISSRSPLQWSSSQTVLNKKSAKQLSSAERINLSCPQWLIHFESASNRQVSAGYVVFLLPDAVSFYT